jgi:Cu2+-exporting ATPase
MPQENIIYTCPMHPEVRQDKPGICPQCGMNLLPSKKKEPTHDKHEGHDVNIFARKFYVSLFLTVPVVLYSELPERILAWTPPVFTGSGYIGFILGSVVFFYGGWVFIIGAFRELRAKLPGMMTLIAIAVTAAYLFSTYAIFANLEHTLFWELTTLITIMLLGHWIEMRAVQGAQGALKELSKLLPDTAEVVRGDKTQTLPLEELKVGDIVIVRPGGKVPADGVVVEGKSDVNESMITGESKPIAKSIGAEVIAGTINEDGMLKVKVSKIGENTFLAGVKRLIAEAQASKSRLQMLSDRAAFYLTLIAISVGAITFVAWLFADAGIVFATERLVAVLVIACPHALGLAVPLVASISTTMAARNGLLIKQRLALESAREVDTILFDKTGTLTKGEYGVDKIWSMGAKDESEVLALAASIDANSEHFIARAIVESAKQKNLSLKEVKDFARIPGKGVKAFLEGKEFAIGSMNLLEDKGIDLPAEIQREVEVENKKGKTIIFVLSENKVLGALALGDLIREESREAIKELQENGLKVAMITGDNDEVAKWVATELGIDEFFANVLPDQKAAKVKLLQERGSKVAMVGDGINDAPALTQADLGVAIGAGTNVAIESAGIILVKNDPRDIVKIIRLSRLTYKKMIQNLFWATGYNAFALPLGAGVLASYGILMQPALAAIFMSLSTVIVALNAVLLKRSKLEI